MQPLQHHNTDDAADIRERNAALSGTSLTSTLNAMSIQRHAPSFPSAIAATKKEVCDKKREPSFECPPQQNQPLNSLININEWLLLLHCDPAEQN